MYVITRKLFKNTKKKENKIQKPRNVERETMAHICHLIVVNSSKQIKKKIRLSVKMHGDIWTLFSKRITTIIYEFVGNFIHIYTQLLLLASKTTTTT